METKWTRGKCELESSLMIGIDGRIIAECKPDNNGECIANASLIAEAFNVANETGLTPMELREQRDELLEACREAYDYLKYNHGEGNKAWEMCKRAISHAEAQ